MYKQISYFIIALSMVMLMTSCKDDPKNTIFTPTNNDVTFEVSSNSFPLEGKPLEVTINRGVASSPLSLPLTLSDPNGVYTLSSSTAEFAANQYTATISLSYDLSALQPLKNYNFTLTFPEVDVAPSGDFVFKADATMPLEYEPYGEITLRSGATYFLPYLTNTTFEIMLAKFTTNYYKIVNFYGSGVDMEFNIQGGLSYITAPKISYYKGKADMADYPTHMFATAAIHPSYGAFTIYVDHDPKYVIWQNLGDGDKAVLGSSVSMDIFFTVSAGYFGWNTDILQVTKVN